MAYTIEFRPRAVRDLKGLPQDVQRRLLARIEDLAEEPRPPGVKKLAGADDLYRIRVGDYRVLYQIQDEKLLVVIVRIGHRSDIYS